MLHKKTLLVVIMAFFAVALTLHIGDASSGNPFSKILQKFNRIIHLLEDEVIPQLGCEPIVGVYKTGKTISYAPGDDGDLQIGIPWPNPRFTDNYDGTVTDNLTGLMWTKSVNIYDRTNLSDALTSCNSCDVGGYTDWYLPNVKQLNSLIDYGGAQYQMLPAGHPFTGNMGPGYYYWSSTTQGVTSAFCISFENGFVWSMGLCKVWCARGGN